MNKLKERTRWILSGLCMICCAIFFDMGWTFPFAPYLGWLSHPVVTVAFSVTAGFFFVTGLLIARGLSSSSTGGDGQSSEKQERKPEA